MRFKYITLLAFFLALPLLQAQAQIEVSPEQRRRAEWLMRNCAQQQLTPANCVISVYYHTLRNWGNIIANIARRIAAFLAIFELILLGYSYVIKTRRQDPENILPKVAGRLFIFALVFWILQSWPALYNIPGEVVSRVGTEIMAARSTNPQGLNPDALEYPMPNSRELQNGIIVSISGLSLLGIRFFVESISEVVSLNTLMNPALLIAPFLGFIVMVVILAVILVTIMTTVEIYLGLTIGALMVALATFRGTRMISASVMSVVARGTIQLFLILLMTGFLVTVVDFSIFLTSNANQGAFVLTEPFQSAVRLVGGSLYSLTFAVFMIALAGLLTVMVPMRVAHSVTQYINWNFRELFDND